MYSHKNFILLQHKIFISFALFIQKVNLGSSYGSLDKINNSKLCFRVQLSWRCVCLTR